MADDDYEFDTPYSLLSAYQNSGLTGWIDSARERAVFQESDAKAMYFEPNTAGTGVGQRALLWQYPLALDSRSFSERQTQPDCTSHAARNARDTSRAVQILVKREPETFICRGATEPTYGARGHGGAGMSVAVAARFERDVGFLIRRQYEPVDLTVYDGRIGARWGRSGTPQAVRDLCNSNKVGVIRQIRTVADARDALFNGYAIATGQYAAWGASPTREHYHPRVSPGWSHSMATVGMDFTKKFWPFNVFFIANSWGAWCQAPREWPSDYPPYLPGMIVCREEDYEVCLGEAYVYGSIDGYPPQHLPDYGAIGMLRNE